MRPGGLPLHDAFGELLLVHGDALFQSVVFFRAP